MAEAGPAAGGPARILQIICFASIGGAEKNTMLLTRALARRGYACHLVAPPGDYLPQFEALRDHGVILHVMDFRKDPWKTLRGLRALIRSHDFRLIHSHMYLADFMLWLAALGLALPARPVRISTLHVSILNQTMVTRLRRLQQRLCSAVAYRAFDKVFTVSESMRREAIGYFRLPPAKVVTSLNSIDLAGMAVDPEARNALSRKHGLGKATYKIVCVGSFHPLKSQITLIQALGEHLRDLKDVDVYLLGDGGFKAGLQEETRRLGMEDRVHFMGLQGSMNEWYSLADMFVHTSYTEALSRSILEAMYMKLPVAASDIPSTREIVAHGGTGLLFPPGDARLLADAIRTFHSDPSLAARCAERAHAFVAENCDIESMTDKLLAHSLPAAERLGRKAAVKPMKGAPL